MKFRRLQRYPISIFRGLLFFGTLATCLFPLMYAQTLQSGIAPTFPTASAASYYYIAKPGELTIQVNVWGFVKNPGRYEVSSSTDLVQLLSFAGGPSQDAKLSDVKITRFVKRDTVLTKEEITVDLENLAGIENSKLLLNPGDTVFIDHTFWLSLREAFGAAATVALITSTVANLISILQK